MLEIKKKQTRTQTHRNIIPINMDNVQVYQDLQSVSATH